MHRGDLQPRHQRREAEPSLAEPGRDMFGPEVGRVEPAIQRAEEPATDLDVAAITGPPIAAAVWSNMPLVERHRESCCLLVDRPQRRVRARLVVFAEAVDIEPDPRRLQELEDTTGPLPQHD